MLIDVFDWNDESLYDLLYAGPIKVQWNLPVPI